MLIGQDEFVAILKEHGIVLKGVLHVGAHKCEEMEIYEKLGLTSNDVVWIEAIDNFVYLAKRWGIQHIYHAVITDKDDDMVTFNITNNNQSSSILELNTHLIEYPDINYVEKVEMQSVTIDTFFKRNGLDAGKYNMWNIDIQGAELLALKGGIENFVNVDVLYLEVNECELYKGCALVGEVDTFLDTHGFKRVRTKMTSCGWGDAIYINSRASKE